MRKKIGLVVLLSVMGCSTVKVVDSNLKVEQPKTIQSTVQPSALSQVEKDGLAKLKGGNPENASSSPSPTLPSVTPKVVNVPTEQQIIDAQKPRPTFNTSYPYPEDKSSGILSIVFKDEFQVRYYSGTSSFVSKTGESVKILNDLILNKKVEFYSGTDMSLPLDSLGNPITEKDLEKKSLDEKTATESSIGNGYSYPNKLSVYKIVFKNIDIKQVIDTLKAEKYVLSVNFSSDFYIGSPSPSQSSSSQNIGAGAGTTGSCSGCLDPKPSQFSSSQNIGAGAGTGGDCRIAC